MAFFCRFSNFDTVHNLIGYTYVDLNQVAFFFGVSKPDNFDEARSYCDTYYSSKIHDTVDGQMIYSDGSVRGFFDGVTASDVLEVSWLIVLIWAIAYCHKLMTRSIPHDS